MDLLQVILPLVGSIVRLISDRAKDQDAQYALDILAEGMETGAVTIESVMELRERIRDAVEDPRDLISELDARLEDASRRIRDVDLGTDLPN